MLCNEAGVPVHEMMDDDVAARELTLDTKMRAFFRLSAFSHRCAAPASIQSSPLHLHHEETLSCCISSDTLHCARKRLARVYLGSVPSCLSAAE